MPRRPDSKIFEPNFSLTEHIQSLVDNSVRSFLVHYVPQLYVGRRKMIGLKRGKVQLAEYDSSWPDEFLKERDSITSAIGAFVLRIEHIGSTAIPGIKAKPLIDIAAEVEDETIVEKVREALETKGYTYFGDRENRGDYFLAKGPDSERTHYLHLSTKDSSRFNEVIYFRDRLRADKQLAETYEELKVSIALEHAENRKEYTKKKESFIINVMKEFSNQAAHTTPASAPR